MPKPVPTLGRALAIHNRMLDPDHPNTADSLNDRGVLLKEQGNYAAARSHLERALAIRERVFGVDHPHTAHSLHTLGVVLRVQREYAAARPYLERALECEARVGGLGEDGDLPHTGRVNGRPRSAQPAVAGWGSNCQ